MVPIRGRIQRGNLVFKALKLSAPWMTSAYNVAGGYLILGAIFGNMLCYYVILADRAEDVTDLGRPRGHKG